MKKLLIILVLSLFNVSAEALSIERGEPQFELSAFREIPVLHEGRVKPLDSFARAYLLAFYGKSSLPNGSAVDWLVELLFDPEKSSERRIFNIPNPEVVESIGLSARPDHHYSFNEISKGFLTYEKMMKVLSDVNENQLTPSQRQLLEVYTKTLSFAILGESFTLLAPNFKIHDASFAKQIRVLSDQELSFLDLLPHDNEIMASIKKLKNRKATSLTAAEKEQAQFVLEYLRVSQHRHSSLFRVIPPQWRSDNDEWTSPWATLFEGHGSPQSAGYLEQWKRLSLAYHAHDAASWNRITADIHDQAYRLAGSHASLWKQKLEVIYLRADLFTISLVFFIASFLMLMTSFLIQNRSFYKVALVSMPLGALLQLIGILMRITILGRPPVSTLYETTLFVSLIAVILSVLVECKRRDVISLTTGSIIGSVLLFISTRYAADGDTMEMLVAVLNTNFWLATHVVAVTIGYGCSLVAGTLGHFYLINRWLRPKDDITSSNISNSMIAVALIAVFFATLGTILGGIWADQSWGRFWGWDPKENGAMLIVLWLLWVLHGRLTKVLSSLNFAMCLAATNIIVALSWFGVNLLSIGLHSYGFANNIASNLEAFCALELLFLVGIRILLVKKLTILPK